MAAKGAAEQTTHCPGGFRISMNVLAVSLISQFAGCFLLVVGVVGLLIGVACSLVAGLLSGLIGSSLFLCLFPGPLVLGVLVVQICCSGLRKFGV